MESGLNNPVFTALNTRQQSWKEGQQQVGYFPEDVCPFVGIAPQMPVGWAETLPPHRSFSVMQAGAIGLPEGYQAVFATSLYQMVATHAYKPTDYHIPMRILTAADVPQMLALTALTKPGPFYNRTHLLGRYVGIFDGPQLVAMAGERLQIPGYTEISAICTHPNYLGKGYAAQLITYLQHQLLQEGTTPFLHVKTDNDRAVGLYEQCGFSIRREVDFLVFRKGGGAS